ncbi:MAG TPA: ectonucleotide pyrophosphatase/phosphodiesterase [Vicinamibacterales bacterium]
MFLSTIVGLIWLFSARTPLIAQPPDGRHVVIISIDGLKAATYTAPGPSKVPTLRRLASQGAFASGVVGVTPTVTYPSHTTLLTGVPPAVHGIYNNRVLDPEETSNGSWYWYARDIRVPTLTGAVKSLGLTTAAVNWPVTVGADVDLLVPEYAGVTRHPVWLELLRALSSPRHLLENYESHTHALSWPMTDDDRAGIAEWIWRTYRPHLLLLHIFETDDAQHEYGPDSPEALDAIERADARVGRLVSAIEATGLQDRTDVVVVSDHGFLPIRQQLNPNAAFRRAGLLDVDGAGRIRSWDAYFYTAGGSGFVMLSRPGDVALRDRVDRVLRGLADDPANGILTIWSADDLHRRGADPRASFGIDMRDGFYTGAGHDALLTTPTSKGGHGFASERAALHASLIMTGPDVTTRGDLGVVRMTQIGPTIASWFDVALSPKADEPLAIRGR